MATVTQRVVRNARARGCTVLTHKQWDSRHIPTYVFRRKFVRHSLLPKQPVDTIWQHISVTRRTGDIKADVRMVEDIGWKRFLVGFSYNFAVDMLTGKIAVGQPLDAKGAHTLNDKTVPGYSYNQNKVSVAIVVIGMPGDELSPEAKLAITRLIAAMMEEGACTPDPDYNPHSMVAYKDCPCEPTRKEMPDIIKGAKRLARS
jgi:hypothetical protein